MKQTKSISLFFLLCLLSCFACFKLLSSDVVFAEDERSSIVKENSMACEDLLEFQAKELICIVNEYSYNTKDDITTIRLKCNSKEEISNIEFSSYSSEVDYEILKYNFNIFLKREYNYNCSELGIFIETKDNELIAVKLFILENAQGVFFSIDSLDKAKEEWINYIVLNGLVSNATEKTIRMFVSNRDMDSDDELYKYSDSIYKGGLKSSGNEDTYVSGMVNWTTLDNHVLPIREMLIELYDRNDDWFGDTLLGSAISDELGFYSIAFQNNDTIFDHYGSDIYIKIYAGDGNIQVRGAFPSSNHQDSRYAVDTKYKVLNDITTGGSYTINETITMVDTSNEFRERACQAIQISQALVVARSYAAEQMGYQPDALDVWYPWNSGGCYYRAFSKEMYIPFLKSDDSDYYTYESWDVIMHEYGHHIQYQIGLQNIWDDIKSYIENRDTSYHNSKRNDADLYGKDVGIKLAWTESWPTVFGLIAQSVYHYKDIYNVPTVRDSLYTSYNGLDYDLESADIRLGEACERSIMAVLWDIYDSGRDDNDDIYLGADKWWNITTISGTYTFSAFVQNFYNRYSDLTSQLGENLEYYKMCPSDFDWTWGDTTMLPPTISWDNDSGWSGHPFDEVVVIASDQSNSVNQTLATCDANHKEVTLTQAQWDSLLAWHTSEIQIQLVARHKTDPLTGPYKSHIYVIDMPRFSTILKDNGTLEITGTIGSLEGYVNIPSTLCGGVSVTSIANNAFAGQTGIKSITIPSSIKTIGEGAFNNCTNLFSVTISSESVKRIENNTFKNCPLTDLYWPNKYVKYIGDYAFYGSSLSSITISKATSYIGAHAFANNNKLTIYSAIDNSNWSSLWNSSNRPFIKNCVLSNDAKQVVSFEKTSVNPMPNYNGSINNPTYNGYSFSGWYTTSDYSGDSYSSLESAPDGILYAKWKKNSSGSCVTEGSLITLADGTKTAVENLTGDEELLVWDMLNGTFTSAPILFIDSEETTTYDVITLTFSDSTQVEVIDEHAFFDTTLNKYVFLRNDASQYIGHYFKKQSYDLNDNMILSDVQLLDVTITQQVTTAYSPVTYGHLCYYVNGMLSMPGNTESFINIFDVDSATMSYDQISMAQDISIYGLYTYEEFNNIVPIPEFIFDAFNGQYLKIAIGKGIATIEEIQALLDRYSVLFWDMRC